MLNEKQINELNSKGLYTTGQFCKMLNIEKSTLHYYDSIGLFSPSVTGENGYRYYSWRQFDEIVLIITLRELDMPISEIKEYIKHRTPEIFLQFLNEASDELEKKLQVILKLQKFINGRRKITEEALNAKTGTVQVQDFPEEYFYVTPFEGDPDIIDDVYRYEGLHNKTIKLLDIHSPYSVGEITNIASLSDTKVIHHEFFQTKLTGKNDYNSPWIRPNGKYLTIYHREGYWKNPKYQKKLIRYAHDNHMKTDNYFYDEYLLDELSLTTDKVYLIKISIMIL